VTAETPSSALQRPAPSSKLRFWDYLGALNLVRRSRQALDRLLARLNANKLELLMVLDRPEIPLHTNGSENDIRCHVTRRMCHSRK
jgi:hypothetical protein